MKPTDFSYYLTNYLSIYLPGQQGVSVNTVKSYRDTFMLLLRFCKDEKGIIPEKLSINLLKPDVFEDFLNWLESERHCGISTRNQRLTAIRSFYKYLQYECPEQLLYIQKIISIPLKRQPSTLFPYLTLDGIKAILQQPDTTTRNGYRDLVLLSLLYDTGARVQELADIKIGDVRFISPATIRLEGKGRKARIVPLMTQSAVLLEEYLLRYYPNYSQILANPLFCSRGKNKLTRSGISYILSKYANMARIDHSELILSNVTPHVFRHSKAMHLLEAGVNLIYIRDVLGHVNIKTTEIYARADADMKRKALETAYQSALPTSSAPSWQTDTELLVWLQNLGKTN